MRVVAAATTGDDPAVAFQIDPTHSGGQPADTLSPPLLQQWNVDLRGPISYPLIAGGRAFVTVNGGTGGGPRIYALDLITGATLWGPIDVGGDPTAAAYEAGRIFSVNRSGVMEALDASTGQILWVTQLEGQWSFEAPPTALNGVVYTQGGGLGGTVYAVNEGDGSVKWSKSPFYMDSGPGAPVVTASGVYVADPFQNLWDFDPASGATLWNHLHYGSGIGGSTAALYGNKLYARYTAQEGGNLILDASTGAELGTFSADAPPAFSGNQGFFRAGSTLTARDLTTNAVDWQFSGDGLLNTAPIVANGYVYIGSSSGNVYVLPADTGSPVTTINVGTGVTGFAEGLDVSGLAIGSGRLLVPAGTHLAAYANRAPAPSPSPTPMASASLAPPTGGLSQASATQIDAAHSGLQPADATTPPLAKAWVRDLPNLDTTSAGSFPLVADGKAFVRAGSYVYAIDLQTGRDAWTPIATRFDSFITYADSRLFIGDSYGNLRAFSSTTGALLWNVNIPFATAGPPVAFNGIIYVGAYANGGKVYAVSEWNGALLWNVNVFNGDGGAPAVANSGLYVVDECGATHAFNPTNGAPLWFTPPTCSSGGGGATPALYAGRLYVRNNFSETYAVHDAGTGKTIRLFGASSQPAFDGSLGFFLAGSSLVAEDLQSGFIRWAFSGDGGLITSPIVVNGNVYVGSTSGLFYAVAALTGEQVWSDNLGVGFADGYHDGRFGLGAGEGLVIAPAGTRLAAYGLHVGPVATPPPNPPVASLSPDHLTFPDQIVETTSAALAIKLTNTGGAPLTISGIALSGDFAQTNTCGALPAVVGAGGSCTISVTFAPTGLGVRTGALTITDGASGSPQSIAVTGRGLATRGFSVSSWGRGRLDVFMKGADGALWHKFYDASIGWQGWSSLGAPSGVTMTSDPVAISWGYARIDVFVRGSDNALWHKYYDVNLGGWSIWYSHGGMLTSGPTATSWGSGRLDVFYRGTDNTLRHIFYASFIGVWSAEYSHGGNLASDPSAITWGVGRIDVVARGTDGTLQHDDYDQSRGGWLPAWEGIPGSILISRPTITTWGPGRLDVFAVGTDNSLQHTYFYAGQWQGWSSQGIPNGNLMTSDPGAVAWSFGRLDIFARGQNVTLLHKFYDSSVGWSDWFSETLAPNPG